MIGQIWDTCGSRGSPLPRIFVHSIKNQAKINMGLMGESTQNRRKNQNLRTPSRRVANPSERFGISMGVLLRSTMNFTVTKGWRLNHNSKDTNVVCQIKLLDIDVVCPEEASTFGTIPHEQALRKPSHYIIIKTKLFYCKNHIACCQIFWSVNILASSKTYNNKIG